MIRHFTKGYTQKASKHLKRTQPHQSSGKYKLNETPLYSTRMAKNKSTANGNVGKDVQQRELSCCGWE